MKPYLFFSILLFASCTDQSETTDKNEHGTDYVTAVQDLKKVNAGNGEWVYQMEGHEHDFKSLSFAITETEPGGGPPMHVHETEEAHILMSGKITYHIGDSVFTATGPFVARVPPNVPHTFINSGDSTFNLIAVFPEDNFGTYNPVGDNPLIKDKQGSRREGEGN